MIHIDDIQTIFKAIKPYCSAIYFGGSHVDPVIAKPHDYDFICFAEQNYYYELSKRLEFLGLKKSVDYVENQQNLGLFDISQLRVYPYKEIDWFSYLDILMIKVAGEDVCPKTDIIIKYRSLFLKDLQEKTLLLNSNKISNQKRWYHILRGVYILLNNSYEVTEEQKREINILHDLAEGWEEIRDKTIKLLETLK